MHTCPKHTHVCIHTHTHESLVFIECGHRKDKRVTGSTFLFCAYSRWACSQNILQRTLECAQITPQYSLVSVCWGNGSCKGPEGSTVCESLFFVSPFFDATSMQFFLWYLILYILASQGEVHEPAASPWSLFERKNASSTPRPAESESMLSKNSCSFYYSCPYFPPLSPFG